MCGIAGIVDRSGRPTDGRPLTRMLDAIAHRGPDAGGMTFRPAFAFGARRLAIVDVVHGVQPVWSEDGQVVAVMNGEIFNHHELRRQLKCQGVRLRSDCDAELIPALYRQYGRDFVNLLNGQFSIALYDASEQVFLAWRDQFGICPFFFAERDGVLIFGSEIKAILQHPAVSAALDPVGLDQILTFPGPVSPRTMFKDIHALPPGCWLESRKDRPWRTASYWDFELAASEANRSVEDWAEEFSSLLFKAVKRRIADEVPTTLYLSGGLDSSLVGSMFRKICASTELDAFSIDFDDALVSEAKHQSTMAHALNARRHVTKLGTRDVWDRLDRVVSHTETPLRETFNAASLALSEMAHASGYKVALAGQGADELFAGYVGYRFDARGRGRNVAGSNAESVMNEQLWGDPDFVYERRYGAFADVRRALYSPDLRAAFHEFDCTSQTVLAQKPPPTASRLGRRSYIDCKLRLADHLLAGHGDRMAMANGVEVRYPFLDREVASFASRLPDALKLNGMKEKYVVKFAARAWLPAEIVDREKFGFTAPGSPTLLGLGDERIACLLSEDRLRRQNVFDVEEVRRLREKYSAPNFRINVPFETDLLITVITYGMFSEAFNVPDL